MPEPPQQHHDGQINVCAPHPFSVAPEGNIEVIPQPGGKRNVPSSPELGDGLRQVRGIEVFRKNESQHQPEADGHIGIGAEIEVDLKGIGSETIPGVQDAAGARIENHVGDLPAGVGEQHLLRQAEADEGHAPGKFLRRMGPIGHLVGNLAETDDGAGHELGKEGDIAGEIDEIAQHLRLAAIDIDGIAQQMEGVKTDAQGQGDANHRLQFQMGQSKPVNQEIVVFHCEIEVLEKSQHGKARADGNGEPDLFTTQAGGVRSLNLRRRRPGKEPLARYFQAADIVDQRGGQQQDDETEDSPSRKKRSSEASGPDAGPGGEVHSKRQGSGAENRRKKSEN